MSTDLPAIVSDLVGAINTHDREGFLASFGEFGIVDDWGREFVGPLEIGTWSDKEFLGANGTLSPVAETIEVMERGASLTASFLGDWASSYSNGRVRFVVTVRTDAETAPVQRFQIRKP